MGERKRREERLTPVERAALEVTHRLAAEGRIIEGGLAAHLALFARTATPERRAAVRLAYMAGAEHLFSSIMATLDEGSEPTDADLARMDKIQVEITRWREEFARDHYPTRGTA